MRRTVVNVFNFFAALLILPVVVSCNKQTGNRTNIPYSQTKLADTLHSISSSVKMVYIPGGEYKPFYSASDKLVTIAPFLMDERAVTNQEFLEFVKANPQWQKSNVKRIFADTGYLHTWPDDTHLPMNVSPDAPVCNVSWFAAKAYAQAVGKRLPTLDEWEFVAMADASSPNARKKPEYSDAIIDLYSQKNRQYNAVKQSPPNYWGIYNMFDLIWEWTDDFNSILSTLDSRNGQDEDKNLFCAGSATTATDVLNYAAFMRFALRSSIKANYTITNLGFRCAGNGSTQQNK